MKLVTLTDIQEGPDTVNALVEGVGENDSHTESTNAIDDKSGIAVAPITVISAAKNVIEAGNQEVTERSNNKEGCKYLTICRMTESGETMNATFTAATSRSRHINSTRTVSCACHSTSPDSSPCGSDRLNHLSQGCIAPRFRDGLLGGYPQERHHRQENRRNVLHSF